MEEQTFESWSEQETLAMGEELGRTCQPGDIICLNGDLGVGKTVFCKGFARGLEIEEPVSSPTFTILQIHEGGRLPLYHFDVYRIADVEEMEEIGYEDYFFGEGVCLIEWASVIEELLPDGRREIFLQKDRDKGFDYRRIVLRQGVDL